MSEKRNAENSNNRLQFYVTDVTLRHQTEPKPFYLTVGHLNAGSVGRLIPTMCCKMPGEGFT